MNVQKARPSVDSADICILYIKGIKMNDTRNIPVSMDYSSESAGNEDIYAKIKKADINKLKKLEVTGCGDFSVVTSFTMNITLNTKQSMEEMYQGKPNPLISLKGTDEYLTDKMIYWVKRLDKGCRIDFEDVLCQNKYGDTKTVKPVSIVVY